MPEPRSRTLPFSRLEYKWRALAAVAVGTFMATLDSSIVNVSLPTLSAEFTADILTVGWVPMAYLLTLTGLLLSMGRLSDMVGRKRIYQLGFLVFTAGSLLCGEAGSIEQLIGFRVLQAVGAAMLTANGAALVTAAFPRSERGKAMGLNGTIVASGLMVGPLLGGLILDGAGWRWIFRINLPVGIAGMLLAAYLLRPDEPAPRRERFDFAGAGALLLSLTGLLLALSEGKEWGWGSPQIVTLLLTFVLFLTLFVRIEGRVTHPMVDLSLFRNRLFAAGNASAIISYIAVASVMFLVPFYLQHLRGFTAAQVGGMITIVPLSMLVVSPASGWLSDRIGSRILSSAGLGVLALALYLLSRIGPGTPATDITLRLALVGMGTGLFTSPNSSAIMGAVPPQRLGIASGMISTVRNTGMLMGIAIAGTIFAARRASLLDAGAPDTAAFAAALSTAFLAAAAITAAGIIPSLVRGPEERRAAAPPDQPAD